MQNQSHDVGLAQDEEVQAGQDKKCVVPEHEQEYSCRWSHQGLESPAKPKGDQQVDREALSISSGQDHPTDYHTSGGEHQLGRGMLPIVSGQSHPTSRGEQDHDSVLKEDMEESKKTKQSASPLSPSRLSRALGRRAHQTSYSPGKGEGR